MRRLVTVAFAVYVAWAAASPYAQSRRPIRDTDLLDFVWTADPQIAPDGSAVAFVRVVVERERDTYASSIWVVPAAGGPPRAMTTGRRDTTPRWSPDGRRLAFLRIVEGETRPSPAQVYALSLEGGEPTALTSLPEGVTTFAWAPDGHQLVVGSNVRGAVTPMPEPGRPRPSDARIVTRATFRADGTGFVDAGRRSRVFLVTLGDEPGKHGVSRPVGRGRLGDQDPVWSPDGSRVFFTAQTSSEPDYAPPRVVLMEADVSTGAVKEVAAIDGAISRPSPSPDGTHVAFIASLNGRPVRSYSQPDLFVVHRATGTVTNLTERYDYDIDGGLTGDQRAPRGSSSTRPIWTADGQAIVTVAAVEGRANLVRIDAATGAVSALTEGDHEVQGFTATRDGQAALLASSPTRLCDLQLGRLDRPGSFQLLAATNGDVMAALDLSEPETFWTRSFDGTRIQGWILKPSGFDPSKTYPLVLQIHGGPHAAYGATFTHEFLWMAAKGYVVVYTNPRGSTTYGQRFGNSIQHRYPGDDYRDLMAALDEVVGRGYVDPTRLGVTGGSGGGVLTNWALTRTTRFTAAVSQRSIADWEAWWYSADFTLFTPSWFKGPPWQQQKDFVRRSPIAHVDRITTPLMLVEGDADYRTPPAAGGDAMFRALKYRKVPVVMVRFPDEGHELSRSGAPWRRVDRLRHIVGWFDKWLKGEKRPEYDGH
ncbi:MAG: S9 family peptidase [Vicinamibacteria bacterium]|nr:S9 family peptidase [Vicinamibacteria bacterium]